MDITVPKTKIDYCIWIIGGLLFLSALTKIKLLLGIVNFQQLWAQALIIILFGSVVSGFIGICFRKMWGFFFLYIYITVVLHAAKWRETTRLKEKS